MVNLSSLYKFKLVGNFITKYLYIYKYINMSYTLEQIWNFDTITLNDLLTRFNWQSHSPIYDKLSATILLYNSKFLSPSDHKLLLNPNFQKYYLMDDTSLLKEASSKNILIPPNSNHIQIIRYLIEPPQLQISQTQIQSLAPSIPSTFNESSLSPSSPSASIASSPSTPYRQSISHTNVTNVSSLPLPKYDQDLILYQTPSHPHKIFLCGNKTFNLRSQIKLIPEHRWNPTVKCWEFPDTSLRVLQDFVNAFSSSITSPNINSNTSSISQTIDPSLNIKSVSQPPKRVPGRLGIYQMNNEVLVCGSRTYDLRYRLSNIGLGSFNTDKRCWVFPANQAKNVVEFIELVKQEDLHEQQKLTQEAEQLNIIKAQEEASRQQRLTIPENEQPFIRHKFRQPIPQFNTQEERENWENVQDNLDSQELESLWRDKIIISNRQNLKSHVDAYVTYIGELKPPDLAIALAIDGWFPGNFNWNVERVDYKKYKVRVWTD